MELDLWVAANLLRLADTILLLLEYISRQFFILQI